MYVDYLDKKKVGVYLNSNEIEKVRKGDSLKREQIWPGSVGMTPRAISVEYSMQSYIRHFPPHVELREASSVCVGVSEADLENIVKSGEIALSV